MDSQRFRRIWLFVGIVVLLLFVFAFAAPNNLPPTRRGSEPPPSDNTAIQLIIALAPTAIVIWFLWRMIRGTKPSVNEALAFGKDRYHVLMPDQATLTFKDVGGEEKTKAELQTLIRFLKEPQTFAALGTRPAGVLLVGAPGTGKTLLATALCKEAGLPFFYTSGSEFIEMFVGIGASRIRDLFQAAKNKTPSIVFIDALDAIGRRREVSNTGTQSEYDNALQQLLVEMDGLKSDTRIIVIAATNRSDLLDPALTRSGRFDRQIVLNAPNTEDREAILKVQTRGKPVTADINWKSLADSTEGFVGADLEKLVNEAALTAGKQGKTSIGMAEFESALAVVKQHLEPTPPQ